MTKAEKARKRREAYAKRRALGFQPAKMTAAQKAHRNARRHVLQMERKALGTYVPQKDKKKKKKPYSEMTVAQRQHYNERQRRWRVRRAPIKLAARLAKKALEAARLDEYYRQYPWMRKIKKADQVPCQFCHECHPGIDANACRRWAGIVLGKRLRAASLAAWKAWVCPPCPELKKE